MPLAGAAISVWGFPAAIENDDERFLPGSPGNPAGCPGLASARCASNNGQTPHHANVVEAPLIDNPSVCTGEPLTVSLDVRTYQDPSHASHAEDQYPPTTACDQQTFQPALNAGLTSEAADSPSGMDISLRAAQPLSRSPTPSSIRSATVLLPEGLSVNPDAADGQTACTDAEAGFGSEAPAQCPNSSKIGRFDIRTPALVGPLSGSIYIGEPTPGNQYRLFLVASGFGINAKIVASVRPDPTTGRLAISVNDLPEVPFEEFNLHVFASDRGLIATPTQCTIYQVDSNFTPWNSLLAPQRSRPIVSITSGPGGGSCPGQVRPFSPQLEAGTSNPIAGGFSSFSLKLDRNDGDQFLHDLDFTMPPGLTGSLRGIEYCSEDAIRQAAAQLGRTEEIYPSCRRSSLIGTSNVAAGPGSHPFHVTGRIYLAGPVQGRSAEPGRGHSRGRRALRLRDPGGAGRDSRRSARRPRQRHLRHPADDHRRRAAADADDQGQHRQAELHDQPDALRQHEHRLAGYRGPGERCRLQLLLPLRQLLGPRVQADDDGPPGRPSDPPLPEPAAPVRPADAGTGTQT